MEKFELIRQQIQFTVSTECFPPSCRTQQLSFRYVTCTKAPKDKKPGYMKLNGMSPDDPPFR
jgi:hypothetical protein